MQEMAAQKKMYKNFLYKACDRILEHRARCQVSRYFNAGQKTAKRDFGIKIMLHVLYKEKSKINRCVFMESIVN